VHECLPRELLGDMPGRILLLILLLDFYVRITSLNYAQKTCLQATKKTKNMQFKNLTPVAFTAVFAFFDMETPKRLFPKEI